MNRENKLKEYYKSTHWKQFVKNITSDDNCTCELCGVKRWRILKSGKRKINRVFNIHHKHYNTLGKEKRTDVMCLCRACHQLAHEILRRNSDNSAFLEDLKQVVGRYFTYVR